MRVLGSWLLLVALCSGVYAKDEPLQPVRVVRDLTLLSAGRYRMVQSWDLAAKVTEERKGAGPVESTSTASNRLTFAVTVQAPAASASDKVLTVQVKQLEMSTAEGDKKGSYDSAGPVDKQTEILVRQFQDLLDKTTHVGARAFADGTGFAGLNEVWTKQAEAHPDLARMAHVNLPNYGDARVDRMFLQGLDVLYGPEAGRAKEKVRELRTGEEFKVTLDKPGIFMKPTAVEHACKVVSASAESVVLQVTWKINGFEPEMKDRVLHARGGDIQGEQTLTFRTRGGVLMQMKETVQRTDQSAPGGSSGVTQWTRTATEKKEFSITSE